MEEYRKIEINGHSPSDEQWDIIDNLIEGNDCVSDSVPGGGKSTTCYFIALIFAILFPTKKILNLTFSADLKKESRGKVRKLGINNMDIESLNSFAQNFYGQGGVSLKELYDIILKNLQPRRTEKYDLIILDEVQDMQLIFYKLILKYMKDNLFDPQFFIIGDKYVYVKSM